MLRFIMPPVSYGTPLIIPFSSFDMKVNKIINTENTTSYFSSDIKHMFIINKRNSTTPNCILIAISLPSPSSY